MNAWLAAVAASALLAAARAGSAAAPDLALDVRLDPATREFAASAELARARKDFRFTPHPSLSVRAMDRLPSGALRIEYGGKLPPLDRNIDFRGVLQALPPMASPEGSYLGAGSGWYPQAAPAFTYRVHLVVTGGGKGLVEGRLASEKSDAGAYEATFEADAPAEGIDLMAGPYEVQERSVQLAGGKRVRLRTYFFKELAPLAEAYLDDSARYLERYSAAIGAYPFSEFSVVASPLPSGFGMPTLTYLGAQVLQLPFIRASSLGHEVLHNWWGNGVRVDYARGNWSEGLTTFMADYAFKEAESSEAARDMRLGWLRDLASLPGQAQQPLASVRSRAHGADAVVGYGKAAMLFLMLRDAIGSEAFERGIRAFWKAQRFRAASWDDLRAAFEQASRRDLKPFFRQWLTRPGAPRVGIVAAHRTGKGVVLDLEQSAPAYALRLPVEIDSDAGKKTGWLEVDKLRQSVAVELERAPRAVRLDPELRVWRKLDPGALPPILRQWIIAPSPTVLFATKTQAAADLAGRLLESPYREASQPDREPLLIVGLHRDVDGVLERLALPPRPAALANKGSAQVWTIQGTRVAVISARDEASLAALARPLPHYGAQSWLAFDGARVLERGAWPPAQESIPVAR